MTAISGRKCAALYPRSDPVGSVVKMLLGSSTWVSTECFLTWKHSATPSKHLLFQLAPSMPRNEEPASGYWPTPTTQDHIERTPTSDKSPISFETGKSVMLDRRVKHSLSLWPTVKAQEAKHGEPTEYELNSDLGFNKDSLRVVAAKAMWPTPRHNENDQGRAADGMADGETSWEAQKRGATLTTEVKQMWSTPQAHDRSPGHPERWRKDGTKHGAANLNDEAAKMWATPSGLDGGQKSRGGDRKDELLLSGQAQEAALWATPKSSPSGPDYAKRDRDGSGADDLATQAAEMWPTPTGQDAANNGGPSQYRRNSLPLNAAATGTTERPSTGGGSLNPEFVCWLMGYPAGWTNLEPSETP